MKKVAKKIGKLMFMAGLPALRLVLNGSTRTRLLLKCNGRILVVKGWLGDDRWNLPGGGAHEQEKLETAVIREVHEETGIAIPEGQLEKLFTAKHSEYGLRYLYHCFTVELAQQPNTRKQWYEISDVAWMLPNEFNSQNAAEEVLRATKHMTENSS